MKRNPQRLLAYALIAIGVVLLLARIGGADWLWLALIAAIFLVGYVSRKNYNLLVAGGVLMGIAVGTLIGTDSGMLLSLAAGFLAIDRIEPKANRWALYSAGIFAALGALVALGSFGLLSSVAFALVLVAAGAYLLYREGNKPEPPRPPTSARSYPPASAPPAPAPETEDGVGYAPPIAETAPVGPPQPSGAPSAQDDQAQNDQVQAETANGTGEAPAPVSATQPPGQSALTWEAQTRLRRLEVWRRETARTEGVPAYIVFTNDTLAQIAAANPRTLDELGSVKGVGPIKRSRYGETVLNVLQDVEGAPNGNASSKPEDTLN